jgi:hypothetical protein
MAKLKVTCTKSISQIKSSEPVAKSIIVKNLSQKWRLNFALVEVIDKIRIRLKYGRR